jgi:hypothetical protein
VVVKSWAGLFSAVVGVSGPAVALENLVVLKFDDIQPEHTIGNEPLKVHPLALAFAGRDESKPLSIVGFNVRFNLAMARQHIKSVFSPNGYQHRIGTRALLCEGKHFYGRSTEFIHHIQLTKTSNTESEQVNLEFASPRNNFGSLTRIARTVVYQDPTSMPTVPQLEAMLTEKYGAARQKIMLNGSAVPSAMSWLDYGGRSTLVATFEYWPGGRLKSFTTSAEHPKENHESNARTDQEAICRETGRADARRDEEIAKNVKQLVPKL